MNAPGWAESPTYKYYVLAILTTASLLSVADRLVLSILLEDIKAEFGLNDTQLGLLAGLAFTFFYVTLGIPIARFADLRNRKKIVAVAITVWSAMTALCGVATGFLTLFLTRLGVGVGEAGGGPAAFSILGDYFQKHELARAMGILTLGATLGTVTGLMAGGYFAGLFGWRMAFVMLGLPGVAIGAIIYFTVREPPRGRYSEGPAHDNERETLSQTARSLASNKVFWRVSLGWAMITSIGYAIAIWLAPIMLRNFEVSTSEVGLYLGLAFALGGIPGPILGGYLTDYLTGRFSPKWRGWLPAVAAIACLPAFWLCLTATSFWPFLGFFALGYAIFLLNQAPTLSLLQTFVKSGERAFALSIALLLNNIIGQALGPAVVGILSDALVPVYGVKGLNYAVMILCAAAGFLATAIYLWAAAALPSAPEK
jgi:predicted MFS family arabinose efflux permease